MKRQGLWMAGISLLLLGGAVLGQQASSAKLLLSFQRVNTYMEQEATAGGQVRANSSNQGMVTHYPTTSMCLMVHSDGSYYFEKMEERTLGKPKIKAFNGTLAAAELEQLQSITSQPDFRSVSSPPPPEQPEDAAYLKEGEVIAAKVVRERGTQDFMLTKRRYATTGLSGLDKYTSNWAGLEKKLKPFLSWVKDMEKKSQSGAKDTKLSGCPAVET